MPIGSVDQQLAFALEAFHREYLDEQSLGDALRQCLEAGLCIDAYLVDAGLMTTANVDSIVEFLDEQELGEEAWESVSDDLFGTLKASLDRVEAGSNGHSLADNFNGSIYDIPYGEDRFAVLESHARGGLGEVFIANDRQLRRRVAIKQIRDRWLESVEYRERFLREAEITARLEHPGVVPVYAMGKNKDGSPYYAMRFVRGDSLHAAIDAFHKEHTQPSSLDARIQLRQLLGRFVDVCNTIEYAHSRGIIHRDLKPANIMLGKYGETLVVDWGLAKFTGSEESSHHSESMIQVGSGSGSAPTLLGSAVGTPQYMSPEQASGLVHRIGPPSDIYCLGATLYHLLTGRAPHDGSKEDILKDIQDGTLVRPRELKDIPAALESICLKAMSQQRHARYASASRLKQDVEQWLGDESVEAHVDSTVEKLGRWSRRNKTELVAAMVATTLISLGAVAGMYYRNYNLQLNTRLEQREQTRVLSAKATADSLHSTSRLALRNGNYETAIAALQQATETLEGEQSLADDVTQIQKTFHIAESLLNYRQKSRLGQEAITQEQDLLGYATLRDAMSALSVFQHGDWWTRLPEEYISPADLDQLREQIYSDLLLMNIMRMKRLLMTIVQDQIKDPTTALKSLMTSGKVYRSPRLLDEIDEIERFADFIANYRPATTLDWTRDSLSDLRDGEWIVMHDHGMEYTNSTDAMLVGLIGAATRRSEILQRYVRTPIQDDPGIVEEAFSAGTTIDPNNHMLLGTYAAVLFSNGDFQGSQQMASRAVAVRPDSYWAYLLRSKSLYFSSRFLQKTELSEAIRLRQKDHLLLSAVRDANRGVQLAPSDPLTHLFHGDATYELRGVEDAAGDWIRYFELVRNDDVLSTWSFFKFFDTELRRKFNIALKFFRDGERGPNIIGLLAITRFEKRQYAASEAACNELLEFHPTDAFGYAVRGAARYRQGKIEQAKQDIARSIELDANRFLPHQQMAKLLETENDWEASLQSWDSAKNCAKNNLQATNADFGKCRSLLELGLIDKAAAVLRSGVDRHPDAAWMRVAGRHEKLAEVAEESLSSWRKHPAIKTNVRRLALLNGGFELGLEKYWSNEGGKPIWWNRGSSRSSTEITSAHKRSANRSLLIEHHSARADGDFATTEQTLPCIVGQQTYKLICWAKADNLAEHAVSIVLDEDWANPIVTLPSGTFDWQKLTGEFQISASDQRSAKISIVSEAPGRAWLDDLVIECVAP